MLLPVLVSVKGLRDILFPTRNLALLSTSTCLIEHYLSFRGATISGKVLSSSNSERHGSENVCVCSREWAIGGTSFQSQGPYMFSNGLVMNVFWVKTKQQNQTKSLSSLSRDTLAWDSEAFMFQRPQIYVSRIK